MAERPPYSGSNKLFLIYLRQMKSEGLYLMMAASMYRSGTRKVKKRELTKIVRRLLGLVLHVDQIFLL